MYIYAHTQLRISGRLMCMDIPALAAVAMECSAT